jgi:hypothetical protein
MGTAQASKNTPIHISKIRGKMKNFKPLHYALFLALLLLVAACGGNTPDPNPNPDPTTHTLTVNVDQSQGTGTVTATANGQEIELTETPAGSGVRSAEVAAGTSVTLTATPADATTMDATWTGCDSTNVATNTCTVTVNADKTVGVTFAPIGVEPEPEPEPQPDPNTVQVRVQQNSDDAMEFISTSKAGHQPGYVHTQSRYIALTNDPEPGWGTNTVVGIRFAGVQLPEGATITEAYIQFTAREASDGAVTMTIRGEASANAMTFVEGTEDLFNVSERPTTTASQTWAPPAWTTVGEAGAAQRTPDLTEIVQEVVGSEGWTTGNAIAFIITGDSEGRGRLAQARRAGEDVAPLLVIRYE